MPGDALAYYSILGVAVNATSDQIKKQYRALSLVHHPDRPGGSDAEFKRLGEAYATLSDPAARRAYDARGLSVAGAGGVSEEMLEEIFTKILASQHGAFAAFRTPFFACPPPPPPAPITQPLVLTIQQLYDGGEFDVAIEKYCMFHGSREVVEEICRVAVSSGARGGEVVVLRDQGHSINDLVFGDVHIVLRAAPHPEFSQSGVNLIVLKHLTLKEALCGSVISFMHPSGKVVKIDTNADPAVITPDTKKTVRGLGFRRAGAEPGDMIVEFRVAFPATLTAAQIAALRDVL
jgi:DnaJ-class molecular chaperone